MAFTQSDLDELEKAIASGSLKVKYQDKEVMYRSLTEMREVRQMIKEELGLLENDLQNPIRKQMVFDNGL